MKNNKKEEDLTEMLGKYFEDKNNNQKEIISYKLLRYIIEKTYVDNLYEIIKAIVKSSGYNVSFADLKYMIEQLENTYNLKTQYKTSIESYNNLLNRYKILSKELKINSALELSIMISYLLWNGYFSITKEHKYSMKDRLYLTPLPFDIFKGRGVCLEYSIFLRDFLLKCNKEAAIIGCKISKSTIKKTYTPPIKRNIKNSKINEFLYNVLCLVSSNLINAYGNHEITLIKDGEKIFAYDLTNLLVLNLDNNRAQAVNGIGNMEVKPAQSFIIDPSNDKSNIIEKLYDKNSCLKVSEKELKYSFEKIKSILNENKNILKDMYYFAYKDIYTIVNEIDKLNIKRKSLRKN